MTGCTNLVVGSGGTPIVSVSDEGFAYDNGLGIIIKYLTCTQSDSEIGKKIYILCSVTANIHVKCSLNVIFIKPDGSSHGAVANDVDVAVGTSTKWLGLSLNYEKGEYKSLSVTPNNVEVM